MSLTSSQPPLSERPPRELLCEKCRGISWNVLKSYDDTAIHGLGFHGTFRELEDSCDQGCPMCQNLRCMLVYDGVVSKTDDTMHWGITGFGSVMLGSSELPYSERREYFMWKDNNIQSPGQRLPYVQRLAPDTLEDDLGILIDNINEWLTACTVSGKHKTCTSLESCTSPLPTRLIDVGDQDRDIPRLIESETEYPGGSTKPLYLILSYRWGGGNQSARTTHSNVRERRKQIPLQDLPRTIQDAIKITRRMKIRYLWVDAVCIIQPDNDGETEEWLKESANMSDYYSNAYCCIAASSAEDSSDGILVERPIAKFTFKEWHNPGGTTIDPPHSSRRLFRNPLLERGWCLQEWLLSPRILHWTRNGLIWQCKKGFFWEGQKVVHDECPEHVPDSRAGGTRLNNDCLFEMEFSQGQSTEIWRILDATKDRALGYLWSSLIYCYSQMNLTKPGDRLIAIQGIATYLSNRHKINYFAGIFEHGYLDGLLWSREWRGKPITRIEEFPTWSWASAKGTIVLPYVDNDVSIPWMRWTGGFPSSNSIKEFNKTSNRQIHITAPLVPFKVIVESSKWTRGQFTLHSSSLVWPGKQIGVTLDFAEPDSSCFEGTFLLFLRQLREPQMYRDDLNGLVLKRPSSAGCNVYERIGVFGLYPRKFLQVLTLEETRCLEEWRTDVILV